MCLRWLKKYNQEIIIGLLTDKALRGYKEVVVPYRDRFKIAEFIADAIYGIDVVPQDNLDPSDNIKKYKPTHIASGDGWEKCELEAIKKYNLKKINIDFPKKYSSSKILNKYRKVKVII